jgi:hypothetical protein
MKLARASLLLALVTGSLPGLTGCGDDKPAGLSTGVDGSKPIGMVTPTEADRICKSTEAWAKRAIAEDKQKQLFCRITALAAAAGGGLGGGGTGAASDTQLRMTCQSSLDQCMMISTPAGGTASPMCQSFPASCTATVAEYEACLNDVPPFVDRTIAALPRCDSLTQLSLLSLLALTTTLPPTCQTFQMKCGGAGLPGIPGLPGAPMP